MHVEEKLTAETFPESLKKRPWKEKINLSDFGSSLEAKQFFSPPYLQHILALNKM